MSSTVHICAIITPAKGKESRVRELLSGLVANVQKNEKDTSKYELYEQYSAEDGANVFVVEETYKDEDAFNTHLNTDYFKGLGEMIGKENLLAKGLDIKKIKPVAGYGSSATEQ
ncbi:hypothetical protein B0J14DRAFT_339608 [Halenospora varia]|nr:hypothetical protein B0J14DRAFT_339608 [Halenospora varia]